MDRTIDGDEILIGTREVLHRTGLSRSHLYELMRSNQFPLPRKAGKRNRWKLSEIQDWIEALPISQYGMCA